MWAGSNSGQPSSGPSPSIKSWQTPAAEELLEKGFDLIELGTLLGGKVGAAAIDVEIEHRHRRAIRIVAVAGGILSRFLQSGSNWLRGAGGEQTRLEIERGPFLA